MADVYYVAVWTVGLSLLALTVWAAPYLNRRPEDR